MPRVLIAGCGYVGEATADLFHAEGWEVEGWTASAESAERLREKPYPVRAMNFADAPPLARDAKFDAVIHCASSRGGTADDYRRVYLNGARNLADAFPDALLVFTSSTSVYAQTDGEWVTEQSAAEPTTRDRTRSPRKPKTSSSPTAASSRAWRESTVPGAQRCCGSSFPATPCSTRTRDRFSNQAHRDDIAAALFLLVRRYVRAPRLQNSHLRIFNVADGNPLSIRDCYEWLSRQLDRPLPPESAAARPRKRGNSNKRVSSAKLQALGWSPRYPDFAAAMRESILPNFERCGA